MSETHFIPLQSHHLDRVKEIEKKAHRFPWSDAQLEDIHQRRGCHHVLLLGQQVVGYFYAQNIVGEVSLLNIAVDPAYQGKGFGKRLVHFLLSFGEQHQADSIWLEVRVSNQTAYQLYLDAGFHEVDRRINYYPSIQGREDALIMSYTYFR